MNKNLIERYEFASGNTVSEGMVLDSGGNFICNYSDEMAEEYLANCGDSSEDEDEGPQLRTWLVVVPAFTRVEEHHHIEARTEEEALDTFHETCDLRDPEETVEDPDYYEVDYSSPRVSLLDDKCEHAFYADPRTVTYSGEGDIMDVTCAKCGCSGSYALSAIEINWE